jgi:hypothetical protein
MKNILGAISDELISTLRLMAKQLKTQSIETALTVEPIWLSFEPAFETGGGLIPVWEPPTLVSGLAFQVVVGSGTFSANESVSILKAQMRFVPSVQHTPVDRALTPKMQIIGHDLLKISSPKRHQQMMSIQRPQMGFLELLSPKSLWKTTTNRIMLPIRDVLRAARMPLEWVCQWPLNFRPTPVTRFTPQARQIFRDALVKAAPDNATPPIIQAVFGPMILSAFQGLSQSSKGELKATPVVPKPPMKRLSSDIKKPDPERPDTEKKVYLILGQQKLASKLLQAVVPVEAIRG